MNHLNKWVPESDRKLFPLFLVGALMFFTVFVKGIPLITLINEKIGGDKYDPSGEAIIVEGTLFVIRSCVKFVTMNYGCALSDHLGRKPITLFFILPNIIMDVMLIFGEIQKPVIFSVGALWGLTATTIPTLRAWVCDICADDPLEMVNAQGAFRGMTIGPATLIGIPLGTAFALWSNPKYAFVCSLLANVLGIVITLLCSLDDTIGIAREQQRRRDTEASLQALQSEAVRASSSHSGVGSLSPMHTNGGLNAEYVNGETKNSSSCAQPEPIKRAFPSEGIASFAYTHAPWAGFEVMLELHAQNPNVTFLWLSYFLTYCANETYIHTLFNYLLVGGGFTPLAAAMGFFVAGASYSVATEQMLRRVGAVRGNLVGMGISFVISALVSLSSFFQPLAMACGWLFMLFLPLDCSHAGTNGLITRMYPHDRQGEVQGVLEQIATLAVLGGYPGSLLFGYFVRGSAPVYWPGASFALASLYSLVAAGIFYRYVYVNSDRVDKFPVASNSESSDGNEKSALTAQSVL